ncbi:hypothetical protein BH24ACT5_BH24ACT5_03410 [soil metagenome]
MSRRTVFFDDFAGGGINRSTWNVRTTGEMGVVNDEQQAYIDSAETIYTASGRDAKGADGHVLVVHPRHRPGSVAVDGQRFDFISGRIDTRGTFEFRYGSASARMKLPLGQGLWPAFWLLGTGQWPDTGEIDVMEYVGEPDWVGCALHGPGYSGETPLVNKFFFPHDDVTDWHTYSVDWEREQIVFHVDGRVIYRVTRPMVRFFGDWAFDDEKFLILNVALGGVYPFKTNAINSPYCGLPAETVEAIRDDQVKVLVDWIRVTQPVGT